MLIIIIIIIIIATVKKKQLCLKQLLNIFVAHDNIF